MAASHSVDIDPRALVNVRSFDDMSSAEALLKKAVPA